MIKMANKDQNTCQLSLKICLFPYSKLNPQTCCSPIWLSSSLTDFRKKLGFKFTLYHYIYPQLIVLLSLFIGPRRGTFEYTKLMISQIFISQDSSILQLVYSVIFKITPKCLFDKDASITS